MRLGVYLTRRSQLKVLSPVIEAALGRGHDTILVAAASAAKRGDHLDTRELERLYPAACIGSTGDYGKLDALIGLEPVLPDLKATRLVGVDHFYDVWLRPPRTGRNFTMGYHSAYHRDVHQQLWHTKSDAAVVGWLPADQARAAARYDLPDDGIEHPRDSAVFFALKLDVPEPWRQSRQGRKFYYHIFCEARAQAKAEGLRFIVKSRAKNKDPWWLRWLADEYVLDDVMVPYRSLSLLARAKWAVHFESGAGLEAALMGAYSIAIEVPQPHIIDLPGGRLQYGKVAMHDWPSVAQYGLPMDRVPDVDPEQRGIYLSKFVGECDGRAGERVVDVATGV